MCVSTPVPTPLLKHQFIYTSIRQFGFLCRVLLILSTHSPLHSSTSSRSRGSRRGNSSSLPPPLRDCSIQFLSCHPVAGQFLVRQQVLGLYKSILRAVRHIPDPADRQYMARWAREEFKRNRGETQEITIRMMITQGQKQLQELERALHLAKS
uniref:LYR motif-containing protein 2 n=1 Tax=Leptobrachium leishanense TaxID=445787 RepID=A0A8C5PMF8_9ANUR